MRKSHKGVKRIKTGALERRFSMAKAGVFAGAKYATSSAANLLNDKDKRKEKQKEILAEQAQYLVDELGKLKGSVVKLGQLLSLWGEGFLPKEVMDALMTMSNNTAIIQWPIMKNEMARFLEPDILEQLEVDTKPIGAASLGQVYRCTRKTDSAQICLKVQYPGVAASIDSDLKAFTTLLRMTRLVPMNREFQEWLEEVRSMFKREVDYELELNTTYRFNQLVAQDKRYIVPNTFPEYSSPNVVATSYEPGYALNHPTILALSQERRNNIALTCLELCWREVFEWGEMQTDPNFGNYFVKLADKDADDRLILLDFGAVRKFSADILEPGKQLIIGGFTRQPELIKSSLLELGFVDASFPKAALNDFTELVYLALEPFAHPDEQNKDYAWINEDGSYKWRESNLANRAMVQASKAAASFHFSVPPKEMMFLTRKLVGAFALMSILGAEIDGYAVLAKYLPDVSQ